MFIDDNKEKLDLSKSYDVSSLTSDDKALRFALNHAIKKATDDISIRFNFNTAISSIMELVNALYAYNGTNYALLSEAAKDLVIMLAPFVPHITEELWQILGGQGSVHDQEWVKLDESALVKDETEIVVQVNGKVKDKMMISTGLSEDEIKNAAVNNEKIKEITEGKQIVKVIVVKGRLVNIVVK